MLIAPHEWPGTSKVRALHTAAVLVYGDISGFTNARGALDRYMCMTRTEKRRRYPKFRNTFNSICAYYGGYLYAQKSSR